MKRIERKGSLWAGVAAVLLVSVVGCSEDSQELTSPDVTPELATASAATVSWRQVSAGPHQTCGVTTDNRAYCWGQIYNQPETTRPMLVPGGLQFRHVSAGASFGCGVTVTNQVYCWGNNRIGQLGDGTTTSRATPAPVAGGRRYREVNAGFQHVCAVTTDNRAYCWGDDGGVGALGDGTGLTRLRPTAVAGGLSFRQVDAGSHHTCGVTTGDRAFCWGSDESGQQGDGSVQQSNDVPTPVAGGRKFRQISAGWANTCAVNLLNQAFCWGHGGFGANGDGTGISRYEPRRVAGGHRFDRITSGFLSACAENTANRAYCWGRNQEGELGNGTTTSRATPGAVTGGHFFKQVSAGGGGHTCGINDKAQAYCWGDNAAGQVGDGTTQNRSRPTPVADPA